MVQIQEIMLFCSLGLEKKYFQFDLIVELFHCCVLKKVKKCQSCKGERVQCLPSLSCLQEVQIHNL